MALAFPFSAIVGQDEMKLAILIAAVDPSVGGVPVFGDRGTGKSTAVRALAALLPKMRVVAGCPYGCDPAAVAEACAVCTAPAVSGTRGAVAQPLKDRLVPVPVVDLPLGATEDRVVGALDLERALADGVKAFEPGLLAPANRGFLYVDEVNLLEDHLVDLLIDVAASGENVVERDGLSVRHPARFVLVGSGNPEEGDGAAFVERWKKEDERVRKRLVAARARLPGVVVPDAALERAARLCMSLGTDGLRGELTLMRAARAVAALDGDADVTDVHLKRIAALALRQRLRRSPLDDAGSTVRVDRAVAELFGA